MRFRTRAFLLCFIPFALLVSASFWMAQRLVQSTVRGGLLASLTANQLALAEAQTKADLQNSRFLKIEGNSPELKAEMQSLLAEPAAGAEQHTGDPRKTMEDELRGLGEQMGFDLLFVSSPDGTPLAAVVREPAVSGKPGGLIPLENTLVAQPGKGLLVLDDRIFQFESAAIGADAANLGTLSAGEFFHLPQPNKPTVLFHNGEVVDLNLPYVLDTQVEAAMQGCAGRQECDFRLGGASWIGIPMQDLGGGYTLWSLENMDQAAGPIRARLRSVFVLMGLGSLLIALFCSLVSARSIEKPIARVISRLHNAEQTGVLPDTLLDSPSTTEMRELTESYTRAAVAARNARLKLDTAYVAFIGSLANALDARDGYTAGHSSRVSQYACAVAVALGLDIDRVAQIRIGALLHDIGKIGVPDSVLQKPGRLTAEEFAKVKEHPVIGRRILEGVEGLAPYLDAVELHHENWDGSGYPRRQSGEQTPLDARIVHVADAYDAMTSHRSYRSGMSHELALDELTRCSGSQFDARIVEAFVNIPREVLLGSAAGENDGSGEQQLEAAKLG